MHLPFFRYIFAVRSNRNKIRQLKKHGFDAIFRASCTGFAVHILHARCTCGQDIERESLDKCFQQLKKYRNSLDTSALELSWGQGLIRGASLRTARQCLDFVGAILKKY